MLPRRLQHTGRGCREKFDHLRRSSDRHEQAAPVATPKSTTYAAAVVVTGKKINHLRRSSDRHEQAVPVRNSVVNHLRRSSGRHEKGQSPTPQQ